MCPTRYTPRCTRISHPLRSPVSISARVTPARPSCARVTTPCWRDAISAVRSSTVLSRARMASTRQERIRFAPGPLAEEAPVAARGRRCDRGCRADADSGGGAGEGAVLREGELDRAVAGPFVEQPVGAVVGRGRVEEVALADLLAERLVGLLALDRG